jgi:squalene-associated FAD-dependent desaturase
MIHKSHIAIIGGGCAGLSAAAALVERGYQVTLFESSTQLGGRARSVAVETNGLLQILDNGQHILLGAYRETLGLLKKAGVHEKQAFLRLPLQINMQASSGKSAFKFKSVNFLPAPFNLLFGLLFCKGINFSERINAIKFMRNLQENQYQIAVDKPLVLFLINQLQSKRLIKYLWEPLCLAALNTPLEKASTRIFLNVLRDTFSGSKHDSDFLLPRSDLSQILSEPLAHYVQAKGGTIKFNQRVRHVMQDEHGFMLETRHGKFTFSHVVIATSPVRVSKIISKLPKLNNVVAQTDAYTYQPIYTIYLQYPPHTSLPVAIYGLSDATGQWVFDRGILCGQSNLIAVIVSAEGQHQKLTQDELAFEVAKELNRAFPALRKPIWHKVIAEKRATFSCIPKLERPTNRSPIPNLYFAGDYTYPDYPATIEGAVRSWIYCATLIDSI